MYILLLTSDLIISCLQIISRKHFRRFQKTLMNTNEDITIDLNQFLAEIDEFD